MKSIEMKVTPSQLRAARTVLSEYAGFFGWREEGCLLWPYEKSIFNEDGTMTFLLWRYNDADGEGLTEDKDAELLGEWRFDRRGRMVS